MAHYFAQDARPGDIDSQVYILSRGGRTEVNGNERGFGNYGFGCDSIQCLRERNEQQFEAEAPEGDPRGCPADRLSMTCSFGPGLSGNVLYNVCQYYDGSAACRKEGKRTRNMHCEICCEDDNELVNKCASLGVERTARNSRRGDCNRNGGCRGSTCSLNGECEAYCCLGESRNPRRTPQCPVSGQSGVDSGLGQEPIRDPNFGEGQNRRRNQN